MKKTALLTVLMLMAGNASADWYLGAKLGQLDIDDSAYGSTTNTTAVVGYELLSLGFDLALEGEFMRTSDDGDGPLNTTYSANSKGLYLATRTPGPVYLKVRGGLANTSLDVNGVETTETLTSVGLGLGFSLLGLTAMSVEYTALQAGSDIQSNINMINVGVRFF